MMETVIIQNQCRDRKILNTICQLHWVSLVELGLGVATTWFSEREDIYTSIRVRFMVRVTNTQFPEIKYGKIYLRGVGECNQ